MQDSIFRRYDIRGLVGQDLNIDSVTQLGQAIGKYFRDAKVETAVIGFDARESSPIFSQILAKSLNEFGIDVIDIGMVPTPLVYFSQFALPVEAGVMITGSHNPSEYNGFKICLNQTTIFGEEIQKIKQLLSSENFSFGTGVNRKKDIYNSYFSKIKADIKLGERKLKVVLDAGNGVGSLAAAPLYRSMGCEVVDLFSVPDGSFPNHHPDPTVPKNLEHLINTVKKEGADLGIAFDGDGDRIGVVDENGKIIWGDELLIIFATAILPNNPGATILGEVKCSQRLYNQIENLGGKGVMWQVGHSLIKAKMRECGALLAGEMSGHIFFADRYFGFDDAIYAGARLLEILSQDFHPLSSFLKDIPQVKNTPEIRIPCSEEIKAEIINKLHKEFAQRHSIVDIDGVRILFDSGWGLVRSSNTEPILVMRFEADTDEHLHQISTIVQKAVMKLIESYV